MPKKINDITYTINGAVYEVNKVLGAGFLEKVYEKTQRGRVYTLDKRFLSGSTGMGDVATKLRYSKRMEE